MDNSAIVLRRKIIRQLVVDTALSEDLINKVVNHQFEGVVEAMETHGVSTIEIAALCKFVFLEKKARKRLEFLNQYIENTEKQIANGKVDEKRVRKRLKSSKKSRENVRNKLYGYKEDL